jgi:hypothetical protein
VPRVTKSDQVHIVPWRAWTHCDAHRVEGQGGREHDTTMDFSRGLRSYTVRVLTLSRTWEREEADCYAASRARYPANGGVEKGASP